MTPPRAASLSPPRLRAELQTDPSIELDDGSEWLELDVTGDFSETSATEVEISGCRLTGVTLTGSRFEDLRMTDSVLEDCELSGTHLSRLVALRVVFRRCRMSGMVAPESKWQDVEISQCKADLASFRMSSWKRCRIEDCVLADSDLYGSNMEDTRLLDSDLTRMDLSQARFRDVHLHGSTFEDLKASENMKGIVVGPDQVIPLALTLFSAHRIRVEEMPTGA